MIDSCFRYSSALWHFFEFGADVELNGLNLLPVSNNEFLNSRFQLFYDRKELLILGINIAVTQKRFRSQNFLLLDFDKHVRESTFAKFEKHREGGFRATLIFLKI